MFVFLFLFFPNFILNFANIKGHGGEEFLKFQDAEEINSQGIL